LNLLPFEMRSLKPDKRIIREQEQVLLLLLIWFCGLAANTFAAGTAPDFFAPPPDHSAQLPAEGIFPQGRKMAFMGYSGEPARDLTNGFTVAGPAYGKQLPYITRCASNGWPVVAHVGMPIKFLTITSSNQFVTSSNRFTASTNQLPTKVEVQQEIREQIRALAGFKEIVWWALTPEELRPWRIPEMDYLKTACDTIRENDPLHRPIYLYNPNHRDAQTLTPIARQVDILAKGCYVNFTGKKDERAWVGWSMEQEVAALRAGGRPGAIALLNPELCKDPEPAEDDQIRTWVRHDVYLGLASGAKGVLIWSLYPRKDVRRTWQLWYDAYAECGRELNGPRGLAQVFLFGERRSDLKVRLMDSETTTQVTLGGDIETGTTSLQERATRKTTLPAWTYAEFAYGDSRWLFIINSAKTLSHFVVTGWPSGARAEDAFSGAAIRLKDSEGLPVNLAANEVFAVRFSRQ
jgi:hypothetical protein